MSGSTIPRDINKQQQLNEILECAAEKYGDINPVVLELFFSIDPTYQELFVQHGNRRMKKLADDMVNSALYCLMYWYECQEEIRFQLADTVPHHQFLKIPIGAMIDLQKALLTILASAVDGDREKLLLINELQVDHIRAIGEAAWNEEGHSIHPIINPIN